MNIDEITSQLQLTKKYRYKIWKLNSSLNTLVCKNQLTFLLKTYQMCYRINLIGIYNRNILKYENFGTWRRATLKIIIFVTLETHTQVKHFDSCSSQTAQLIKIVFVYQLTNYWEFFIYTSKQLLCNLLSLAIQISSVHLQKFFHMLQLIKVLENTYLSQICTYAQAL